MKPVAWLEPEWGNKICPEVGYEITITSDHPRDLCWIPLYTAPKELSDDEIADLIEAVNEETGRCNVRIFDHTKVLLRKLKEKYEREPKENN